MGISIDVAQFAAAACDVPGRAAWTVRAGGRSVLVTGGLGPEVGPGDG